jgi:hypothetical protein
MSVARPPRVVVRDDGIGRAPHHQSRGHGRGPVYARAPRELGEETRIFTRGLRPPPGPPGPRRTRCRPNPTGPAPSSAGRAPRAASVTRRRRGCPERPGPGATPGPSARTDARAAAANAMSAPASCPITTGGAGSARTYSATGSARAATPPTAGTSSRAPGQPAVREKRRDRAPDHRPQPQARQEHDRRAVSWSLGMHRRRREHGVPFTYARRARRKRPSAVCLRAFLRTRCGPALA